jgi:hypothetical protein
MRRFPRTATTLCFDPAAEPLAEVADGERLVVETADSLCGLAKARLGGAGRPPGCTSTRCWRRSGGPAR